jgi:hypothetical protein
MRNTSILNTLILTICLFSSDLMAQLGKTTLSLGGGQFLKKTLSEKTSPIVSFGGRAVTQTTTTFTPHFALILERRIQKTLSIGGGFHYLTAQSASVTTNTPIGGGGSGTPFISQEDIQSTMGGISFTPKLFFYSDSDFDVYAGLGLGFLMSSTTRSVSNVIGGINQVNIIESGNGQIRGLLDVNIGGRCFFTENLGFYGEVGFVSLYLRKAMAGQAGIIYRF